MRDLPDSGTFWHRRGVYVTGASGFLGGWLVEALAAAGARVVVLVRDPARPSRLWPMIPRLGLTVCRGSVEDGALQERVLREHAIEAVFHLAAQTQVQAANAEPSSTLQSNVAGTWAVLEAARRVGTVGRVVVASSDKAYGAQPNLPYTEQTPLQGAHPYDVSKSCTDLLAHAWHATYGLPVCTTRCANLYGGGDFAYERLVPGTIRAVLRGEAPVLRSDGRSLRDYLYVPEAVRAYLRLAEAMDDPAVHGHAFNVGTGQPWSALEVVHTLLRLMDSPLQPVVRGDAHHEIPAQSLDSDKARSVLGFEACVPFEQGLAETVAWYRQHAASEGAP